MRDVSGILYQENFLMILALLLAFLFQEFTEFTFIGKILKDTIALHGKNNLQPQTDNHKLEDTTAFTRKNNFIVCTPPFLLGGELNLLPNFQNWWGGVEGVALLGGLQFLDKK